MLDRPTFRRMGLVLSTGPNFSGKIVTNSWARIEIWTFFKPGYYGCLELDLASNVRFLKRFVFWSTIRFHHLVNKMLNKIITLLLILSLFVCPIRCAAIGFSACCEHRPSGCCQQTTPVVGGANAESNSTFCCCQDDQGQSGIFGIPHRDNSEEQNSKSRKCCQCICSRAIADSENTFSAISDDLALAVPCRAEFSRVALTKSFLHGDQSIRPGQHYGRALRCLHASFLLWILNSEFSVLVTRSRPCVRVTLSNQNYCRLCFYSNRFRGNTESETFFVDPWDRSWLWWG